MKNMKMTAETFAALPSRIELSIKYGTSRAQNSYGYSLVTLKGVAGFEGSYKECGGGYDMLGSAMGQFIKNNFSEALKQLIGHCEDYYGFGYSNNYLRIEGATGINCMEKILTNLLGYDIKYTYHYNRKGQAEYKTGMKLTKKQVPQPLVLMTEATALTKNILNKSKEYKYISEIYDENIYLNLRYFLKKNPEGTHLAIRGHSNMFYLVKVPKKLLNDAAKTLVEAD